MNKVEAPDSKLKQPTTPENNNSEDADEDLSDLNSRIKTFYSMPSRTVACEELPPLPDAIPIETCLYLRAQQKLATPQPATTTDFHRRSSKSLGRDSLQHNACRDYNSSDVMSGTFDASPEINLADVSDEREKRTRKGQGKECLPALQPQNVIKYRKLQVNVNPQTASLVHQPTHNSHASSLNKESPLVMPMSTQNIPCNTQNANEEFCSEDVLQDNTFKAAPLMPALNSRRDSHMLKIPTRPSIMNASDLECNVREERSIWSTNAWAILQQEKVNKEREKYKHLLKKVAPYIFSCEIPLQSSSFSLNNSEVKAQRLTAKKPAGKLRRLKAQISDDQLSTTSVLSSIDCMVNKDDGENGMSDIKSVLGVTSLKQKEAKKKTTKLPYVAPLNTLKDFLNESPLSASQWLDNFHIKWNAKKRKYQRQIKQTVLEVSKLSAERQKAEQRLQQRLYQFHIVEPDILAINDYADIVEEPEILPLTQEQLNRIKAAIYGPTDEVLISKFSINITRRDIQTLVGSNWLNDAVINFYMNLLIERSEKKHQSHGYPTVYAQNTFFMQRLMQGGHSAVQRWTRKVDIFSKDIMPVPVHVGGVHWSMAIVHLKQRTIKYYDSIGNPNPSVLTTLAEYLRSESLDKRKQPFDTSDFQLESVSDIPKQMNGSDCGVFSCMFAEYITRNRQITFTLADMLHFRHKMILEIVQGELLR